MNALLFSSVFCLLIFSINTSAAIKSEDQRKVAKCIDSKIENVIAYPNQAEITREIDLTVGKGGKEWFCLRSLPIDLKPESLKIKFPKNSGLNDNIVLEKVYRLVQLKEVIEEKLKKLETLLGKRLGAEQDLKLQRQMMTFFKGLRYRPQLGDQKDEPLTFQASDRRILSSFETIGGQISSLRRKIQKLEDEVLDLNESIEQLQVDLNQQNNLQTQSWSYDLYFTVSSKPGKYKAEIKYRVPNVSWEPLYDIRADIDTKTSKINLRLITLAELKQNTLEDWENVFTEFASLEPFPLRIPQRNRWVFEEVREELIEVDKNEGFFGKLAGSAESMMDAAAPQQELAKVSSRAPKKRRMKRKGRARKEKQNLIGSSFAPPPAGAGASLELEDDMAYSDSIANNSFGFRSSMQTSNQNLFVLGSIKNIFNNYGQIVNKLENVSRQYADQRNIINRFASGPAKYKQSSSLAIKANGRNITYQSQIPISLSRGDSPLRVPLASSPLTAELTYLAIPHKDRNVYMRAKVRNTTKKPILGGNAQIFINGKLTTKTNLNSISEKGVFYIDLGMDKNVEIERVVDKSSVDEGVLFKKHKTKVDIKINIANRHNFPISLSLGDRQPMARHKEIEVENLKITEGGKINKKTGLIDWTLSLQPKSKKTIEFSYSVTHPENFILSELN